MKTENSPKGFYIGRFQPFHLGHLSAIKQALEQVEKLYIGIGSSQYHDTPENPFTSQERQEMLEIGLKEADIEDKCEIFLIPDIHDEERWIEHVKGLVPAFEIVFVGNEGVVKKLFQEEGIKVRSVKNEANISASAIRNLIKNGNAWEAMVSVKIALFLKTIKASDRIKKVQAG